jgi:carbon storage regulator
VLVLSRRLHESIVLAGLNVTVTVVALKGDRVRIGIEAPKDIPVMREELLQGSPRRRSRRAETPIINCPSSKYSPSQ